MLANVGARNGIMSITRSFLGKPRDKICWYYNPNQSYKFDLVNVLTYLNK